MLDTTNATKDYLHRGRCVRFYGVTRKEFTGQSLEKGIKSFTLDIDFWEYCADRFPTSSWKYVRENYQSLLHYEEENLESNIWFRVVCGASSAKQEGLSYLYPTFSVDRPKFFRLKHVERLNTGPSIPQHLLATTISRRSKKERLADFYFDAFNVGQGMCSAVHNGKIGFLLDVGAGKPISRPAYTARRIRNDLRDLIDRLSHVDCIISHLDSDHWRLLSWDRSLLGKISTIYIPEGINTLPFHDRAIRRKVLAIGSRQFPLNRNARLSVYRSHPNRSDKNGECLVSLFRKSGRYVLAAGDYAYSRFNSDSNGSISGLHNKRYVGTVVPHHGDAQSASRIVSARTPAIAFFSAGTHQGYNHPTNVSWTEHIAAGYTNVCRKTQRSITPTRLL